MKIERVHVHNYRSIIEAEVQVDDYLLLVGANNAGKTTFLNAIRLFYGDIKWEDDDFASITSSGRTWPTSTKRTRIRSSRFAGISSRPIK